MNTGVACKSLFKYGIHGWVQKNPASKMYWLGQLGGRYTADLPYTVAVVAV